jgi:hypothetical protein
MSPTTVHNSQNNQNNQSSTQHQTPSPSPPRSKTPRKSSKPDRPILNLDHVAKERANEKLSSPGTPRHANFLVFFIFPFLFLFWFSNE